MKHTTQPTWRDYTDLLTPQQIIHIERGDADENHPNGPDWHRHRMIGCAQMKGAMGPGGMK